MSSTSVKIAWNTIVQMVGKVASTLLGLTIVAILTRYLSISDYGTFTFVMVFVTMFGTIADWGLTLITVREASKDENEAGAIIGNVLVIRLALALLAVIAAIITINLLPYSQTIRNLTSLAALFLLAQSLKTSFQIVFNVKMKMHNWAISEFVANLVTLAMIISVKLFGGGIAEIVLAYLAGHLVAAGAAWFLGVRLLPIKYSLLQKNTKFLLWESLPMGALLVVFTIYNRLDTVILSLVKGQEPVAVYGVAYRIFEVLVLGAAYFTNSILPLISNLAHTDRKKFGEVYKKSFVVLTYLGIFVAVVNFVAAPWMVAIVAGSKFSGSVIALRILSLSLIVSYFNHLNGYALIALGLQPYSFWIAAIALIVNLSLNIILIPLFSYSAAAFTTFLTEGLIVVMSLILIKKEIGVSPTLVDFVTITREFITKRGKIFN